MQLIITKLCTHIAFCFSTITIFKMELPTCAMFLLPAECKPLWKDTEVSAIQTVTTNGSTWGGGRKRKKKEEEKRLEYCSVCVANTLWPWLNVCLALPSCKLDFILPERRTLQPLAICCQMKLLTFAHPEEPFGELTYELHSEGDLVYTTRSQKKTKPLE